MTGSRLILGDCVEKMAEMDAASIDAVVCDPPYLIAFMGKEFDSQGGVHADPRKMQDWHEAWAREALRVLKPGGHLLAFGGTRTYHRLACALEDAGFEIRDCLAWMFGSGFPKSLDVSKAIDARAGAERAIIGVDESKLRPNRNKHLVGASDGGGGGKFGADNGATVTTPATEEALRWDGWGTALKPAFEPVVMARKPLVGTVAANVLAHGVGAINVDACRIGGAVEEMRGRSGVASAPNEILGAGIRNPTDDVWQPSGLGRWPANVMLGHSFDCVIVGVRDVASNGHYPAARPGGVEVGTVRHAGQDGLDERHTRGETVEVWDCVPDCPVRLLDEQTGNVGAAAPVQGTEPSAVTNAIYGEFAGRRPGAFYGDAGGASRFFYCSKTSRAERNAGLDGFDATVEVRTPMAGRGQGGLKCRSCGKWKASGSPCRCPEPDFERTSFERPPARNQHPTVKPIDVMRWLLRLVVPPGGTILDPFAGSGSTGCAAALECLDFVGVELDPDYLRIAEARIAFWREHGEDGLRIVAERAAGERVRAAIVESGQLDLLA